MFADPFHIYSGGLKGERSSSPQRKVVGRESSVQPETRKSQ